MSQPLRSASPSETPEIPTLHALPPPRPERKPEPLTPETSQLICELVRKEGISDRSAAALLLVSAATLAHWKEEDEPFARRLIAAREEFEMTLIREIRTARKADGSPDWRARAWLLKHTTAEGVVKAGRSKATPAREESAPAQNRAILAETPPQPVAPPPNAARENRANLPETRVSPSRPASAMRAVPGSAAATGENRTILAETPNSRPEVV
jgi:hypothetical protein